MKYLNVVQDCGKGNDDADKACIPNTTNVSDKNKEYIQYRTYNNKVDIDMKAFDDGQFVLNDGSLILINNYANSQDSTLYISVDLNGFHKNPNRLGHDLFMFQINEKGTLQPMGAKGTKYYSKTNEYCSPTSTNAMNGAGCTYNALMDKTFFRKN